MLKKLILGLFCLIMTYHAYSWRVLYYEDVGGDFVAIHRTEDGNNTVEQLREGFKNLRTHGKPVDFSTVRRIKFGDKALVFAGLQSPTLIELLGELPSDLLSLHLADNILTGQEAALAQALQRFELLEGLSVCRCHLKDSRFLMSLPTTMKAMNIGLNYFVDGSLVVEHLRTLLMRTPKLMSINIDGIRVKLESSMISTIHQYREQAGMCEVGICGKEVVDVVCYDGNCRGYWEDRL